MPTASTSGSPYTIEGLQPGTPYRVRVSGGNSTGASAPSAWVETTTDAASSGTVLFDGAFATQGLTAYPSGNNQNRVAVVNDPVLGSARKVLRFHVREVDNQLTGSPRAQLESPTFIENGDDIWIGYSIFMPTGAQGSGEFFPAALPANEPGFDRFLNTGEVYGQPYQGRSAVMIGKRANYDGLSFQRSGEGNWATVWDRGPLLKGVWHDFLLHEKISTEPAVGFLDLWLNTGTGAGRTGGWQKMAIAGSTARYFMKTLDPAHDDAPNYHKICLYYGPSMGFGDITMYHGHHVIATTGELAAPNSHNQTWPGE